MENIVLWSLRILYTFVLCADKHISKVCLRGESISPIIKVQFWGEREATRTNTLFCKAQKYLPSSLSLRLRINNSCQIRFKYEVQSGCLLEAGYLRGYRPRVKNNLSHLRPKITNFKTKLASHTLKAKLSNNLNNEDEQTRQSQRV